ncbi:hypothetical protein SAMD00019534_058420 [Acytostelium subglobosum LB1]|uniref:hypothetical protein n=1 Tax=Acytostelium subglobosum LB1 TaxID=1410327 RepID=UPI000644C116|nr:hypothetical protein SAMD00019534_058420 [Acytostelium subglobosum LB1]GAM22667.1 hypothetical protein SAMD00019534_058420 [Acytostelium subglobosum LB1]|eukprot:XP_012754787.1 hypothetical protein SAMD00019534_058420 [Acytostelium subglobosum LB1]
MNGQDDHQSSILDFDEFKWVQNTFNCLSRMDMQATFDKTLNKTTYKSVILNGETESITTTTTTTQTTTTTSLLSPIKPKPAQMAKKPHPLQKEPNGSVLPAKEQLILKVNNRPIQSAPALVPTSSTSSSSSSDGMAIDKPASFAEPPIALTFSGHARPASPQVLPSPDIVVDVDDQPSALSLRGWAKVGRKANRIANRSNMNSLDGTPFRNPLRETYTSPTFLGHEKERYVYELEYAEDTLTELKRILNIPTNQSSIYCPSLTAQAEQGAAIPPSTFLESLQYSITYHQQHTSDNACRIKPYLLSSVRAAINKNSIQNYVNGSLFPQPNGPSSFPIHRAGSENSPGKDWIRSTRHILC